MEIDPRSVPGYGWTQERSLGGLSSPQAENRTITRADDPIWLTVKEFNVALFDLLADAEYYANGGR